VNGWLEVKMVFMKQVGKGPQNEYREDMFCGFNLKVDDKP
jgi:hypothetical protein